MKRISQFIIPALAAAAFAAAAQTPAAGGASIDANERVIRLHAARVSAAPGHIRMQSVANGATVYVQQASIVDDEHIARVRAYRDGGNLTLDILLTPQGAERLREATRIGKGQHVAVLIGGQLATAVPVVSPLSLPHGRLQIGMKSNDRTAREFSARITAKWPLWLPGPGEKD